MYQTIIKQLEKALECKDDKELRLRVEVLLDMIKDQTPQYNVFQNNIPAPTVVATQEPTTHGPITGAAGTRVNGSGSISSINSEQVNYKRPAGT